MSDLHGETFRLARAAFYGALITTAWFALASLFIMRAFPVPAYYVPVAGGTGGAVWHLLGRVPLKGRVWYYVRWAIVSIVGGLWLLLGISRVSSGASADSLGVSDALEVLGMLIACGIGLAHYAERLTVRGTHPPKHVGLRAAVKVTILLLLAATFAWLDTRQ